MRRWITAVAAVSLTWGAGALVVPVAAHAASGTPKWSWNTSVGFFNTAASGSPQTQTYKLTNTSGSATSSIKVSLSSSTTPFQITRDGCTATSLGNKKFCTIDVTYNPTAHGTTSVTVTASAKKPDTSATLRLTGTLNGAPVAQDDSYTTSEGTTLVIPAPGLLANDSDPDGDPIYVNVNSVSAPAHSVSSGVQGNGYIQYIPAAGFTGTDSFTYQAIDGYGANSNTATVTITVTPTLSAGCADIHSNGYANSYPGVENMKVGEVVTFTPSLFDNTTSLIAWQVATNRFFFPGLTFTVPADGDYEWGTQNAGGGATTVWDCTAPAQ